MVVVQLYSTAVVLPWGQKENGTGHDSPAQDLPQGFACHLATETHTRCMLLALSILGLDPQSLNQLLKHPVVPRPRPQAMISQHGRQAAAFRATCSGTPRFPHDKP